MADPVLKDGHARAYGALIRIAQGPASGASIDHFEIRWIIVMAAAAQAPKKGALQGKSTAGIKHVVKTCTRQPDHQRGGAGVGLVGQHPLGLTEGRAAPHAETAIEPRLSGKPGERFEAVLPLAAERVVRAAGFIAPARALNDGSVSVLSPHAPDRSAERHIG